VLSQQRPRRASAGSTPPGALLVPGAGGRRARRARGPTCELPMPRIENLECPMPIMHPTHHDCHD
jgi:hypothetical protein